MKRSMARNGLILAAFAVVTTGFIALSYYGTKEQIDLQQQQKLLGILNEVIDKSSYTNNIQFDCAAISAAEFLGTDDKQKIYRAIQGQKPVSVAIETTAPGGYNGKIHLVVGIESLSDQETNILGVRILEHKETPGLGDKIELRISDWVKNFDNQKYSEELSENWAVKKDGGQFDQFTGATITPRAVVEAVKQSAKFYLANKQQIFAADNACQQTSDTKAIEAVNE